ncbi:TetR/AcrR family transcriptional regulator [Nocardioides sp. GY 10113]|uniref:TetR/AcrR family transcriptional regulator n=1 Tax=Nocardioides sp. GY 10113 TaxID=2569761 RepID=UPI001458EB07|nr:TetR/AcrR family transcriptional regulator [Nocardioides sp. GY 10113]
MTDGSPPPERRAGRPRDPRIEGSALAAARTLLIEGGAGELTMAAIADRADTTKAALYRRWPSLVHLVYDAAFPAELLAGEHRGEGIDLGALVRGTRDVFTTPVVAAALPLLLAEFSTHPELHADLIERFEGVFAGLDTRLREGVEAGSVAVGVRADDLMAAIVGSVLNGLLLAPADLDEAWAERLTLLLERGIRP